MTTITDSTTVSPRTPDGRAAGTWTIDPAHTVVSFSAQATISRRDFGITSGLVADGTKIVVADKIDIALDIEAFLTA